MVLAAVVSLCAGLAVVPLWTALVQGWRFQPITDQCKMLKDAHAREAGDEKLMGERTLPASLYRAYEIGADSPSNSYAPTNTLTASDR